MTQFPLSFDNSLLVCDDQGRYIPASAERILAAARDAIGIMYQRGASFTSTEVVKEYLGTKLVGFESEVFAVIFLDTQHKLIEYVEMFQGTIDGAAVYPREVAKAALRLNAAAVIFAHNHPSGNPEPSSADISITKRLKDALALLDVRTLDHIVIGGEIAVSFAERGLL
jgi:DNA repair protein RadC